MKKMPRKFSEGGTAQPKPAEPKKPADTMPDWAKKDLKDKNADAATKQGYEAATAKDRLKKFKKGGSIKKFAEGGKFSSDVYERARNQIKDRFSNSQEEETTGLDELIKTSPKEKSEAPKAKSSAAPKAAPKPAAKPAAKPAEKSEAKPVAPKSEETTSPTSKSVNQRIKDALTPKESRSVKDNESDSDLSVEPRRYISRGRNYSATGDMSPQAEKAVDAGMTLAALTGIGRLPAMLRGLGRGAGRQAEEIMSRGASRAAQNRIEGADRASAAAESRETIRRSAAAQRAEKEAARRAARNEDELRMADEGNPNFKRGGKVAKYAKGGGIESKGKTKGTVVKMAKGGSVKGWGISRGAKACKMV